MTLNAETVAGWSDEEINGQLCSFMGWGITASMELPHFARDFNALLATKERDGYDGPVAWLMERYPEMPHGDAREKVRWIVDGRLCCDVERGPRALAVACVVAMSACEETKP